MTTLPAPRARGGRDLRHNMLWVLAAILGAATVHAVTRVIHDTTRCRIAAGLVAQSLAEQIVANARHRHNVAGLLALAPSEERESPGDDVRARVNQLTSRQRAVTECACIPVPPALVLF